MNYYLLLQYCRRQCALLALHEPNHLQLKFYTIMQDFKRVWDSIASKRRIEQSKTFDWLSNVKNLVLSNGSKHGAKCNSMGLK